MKAQIEPLGERSQILYLGLPQFFITILSANIRLTHSHYHNAIISCDKMSSSLRWTDFETFLPDALAHRRHRRGMLCAAPHSAPSAFTPTRPAVTSPRAARRDAQTRTCRRKRIRRRALQL